MIHYPDEPPDVETLERLDAWQADVDGIADYDQRVRDAVRWYEARNRESNTTFERVRAALRTMTGGALRCWYCEDSLAHQVEHIHPKSLYPNQVFVWANMLWACGRCNIRKLDRHAITAEGEITYVPRRRRDAVCEPPPAGAMLLLNPRVEDPLSFMILDVEHTFEFVEHPGLDEYARRRARYTIDEALGLNDDPLPDQRCSAYHDFRAALLEYVVYRDRGEDETRLRGLRSRLARRDHQTVWHEIRRQFQTHRPPQLERDFAELFEAAPEALNW
jgi:uncharacterized protein (TIGR02646 family)